MSFYDLNETQLLLFFAALVRVSCLLLLLPIFSHASIPSTAKILLSFSLTLIMFPMVKQQHMSAEDLSTNLGITILVLKEAMVGIVIGFVGKIFFEALTFAFSFMGMQMGFTMATQYDPHTETTTPVVAQLVLIIATLLMLATDTHHLMLQGLAKSFEIIPVGTGAASALLVGFMMETAKQIFVICLQLSAPMAGVIFFVNVAFGIIAKAVPQINILVVSLSVNIVAGFLVLALVMPLLGGNLTEIFQAMTYQMVEVTRYLRG